MNRKNIEILVINRMLTKEEKKEGKGLDAETKLLRARGYNVTCEFTAPSELEKYDLIVAHPPWDDIEYLNNYHKYHPQIGIIIISGLTRLKGNYDNKDREFRVDKNGTYYSSFYCMQGFLKLIKRLSGRINNARAHNL